MDDATAGAIEITKAMLVGIGKGQPDITANGDRRRAGGRGCRSRFALSPGYHNIPADAVALGDQVGVQQNVIRDMLVAGGVVSKRRTTLLIPGFSLPLLQQPSRFGPPR